MKNKYLKNQKLSLALFLSLAILYAIIYMTKNCYSAAMVRLVEEGVLTKSQTGTISAMFYLIYAPFQILGGMAADKYSPYKLITIGFIGAAVANVLITLNSNYYFMMAVWALNGIVQFGVWPGVFKIVASCLAPEHRYNGVFYINFSSTLGLIMSYLLAGSVSGWKMNFTVSAIVLAVCSVYWIVAGKFFDIKMVKNENIDHTAPNVTEQKTERNKKDAGFAKVMITSGMCFLLPLTVLQSVFFLGVPSVTPSMLAESYDGVSSAVASVITVIPIVLGVVGKLLIKCIYRKKVYNECMTIMICLMSLLPIFGVMLFVGKINVWLMLLMVSLVVMISSASATIPFSHMTMRFSKMGKSATVSGLLNATTSLGIVVANYVSPRVADAFDNNWVPVVAVWMAFAAVSVLLAFISYFFWKKFIKSDQCSSIE